MNDHHNSEPSRSSLLSAVFWKLFERGGNTVVQILVQVIMARLLAPEQFGMLSIMLVFVNMGNVIVQSGMNTAIIQAKHIERVDCSTVFWMSFVVSLVLYVVVFAAAPTISVFYSSPGLTWPLRVLTLMLVINAYNAIQVAIITRELDMQKVFRATVASSLASAAVGIGCAFAGAGIWALVAQQLSYQLVNCVVHALQLDWRPRAEFSAESARRLFGFGSRLLASSLLEQVYQGLSDLIIGKQFSTAELGLVSQGKRYPQAVGNVLDGAIQPVMLSAVSRVQSDYTRVKRLVRRALKTSSFLVVPAMALFAVVAPVVVPALLGTQWMEAVPFLQMYCFVYALLPIHTTNLQALNGVGRSDLFFKLEIVKKVFGSIIVCFCAFILQDVHLMVAGYMVSGIISTFVNAWPNRRIIGYSCGEQVRDICPAFLIAAVAAASALLSASLPVSGVVLAVLQTAVFTSVYLGVSALFRVEAFSYLLNTLSELLGRR